MQEIINAMPLFGFVFIAVFLLGSIPWGVLISRFVYHTDIRSVGSGNIGTTNAFRALGKQGGSIVFLLDYGKGLVAVALVTELCNQLSFSPYSTQVAAALAVLCVVAGHIFSPWLKFKGGKGIAAAIGALTLSFGPIGAMIEVFAIFAPLSYVTKRISIGSITAAIACPFVAEALFDRNWVLVGIYGCIGALVVWAHRDNIKRLREGTEPSFSLKTRS